MDQISPPMRIALAVAVVFLAAYMLVLKPKGNESTPAATPVATAAPASASASDANHAGTSLGKAVEAAHGAADATEAKQNAEAAAEGETTTSKPSTSASAPATATKTAPSTTASKPADESLAKLPTWLQHAMDHKVVAILFTNDKAADDRRTRAALKQAFTAHGKVVKRAVPLSQIAKYRPVAQGVDVQQSPTLMVIDRHRQAQALVGYSSVDAINQAIIDGLLATDVPVKHVKFLQTVRSECRQLSKAEIIGPEDGDTFTGASKNLDHIIAVNASSLGTLRNAPAPAAYRGLKHTVTGLLAAQGDVYKAIKDTAVSHKTIDQVKAKTIVARNNKRVARANLDLAAVGINACT